MTYELVIERETDLVKLLNELNERGYIPDPMMAQLQNWIWAEETLRRVLRREAIRPDTPSQVIPVKETTIPAHTRVVPYRQQVFECEKCHRVISVLAYPGKPRTVCDSCSGRKRRNTPTLPYREARRKADGHS